MPTSTRAERIFVIVKRCSKFANAQRADRVIRPYRTFFGFADGLCNFAIAFCRGERGIDPYRDFALPPSHKKAFPISGKGFFLCFRYCHGDARAVSIVGHEFFQALLVKRLGMGAQLREQTVDDLEFIISDKLQASDFLPAGPKLFSFSTA